MDGHVEDAPRRSNPGPHGGGWAMVRFPCMAKPRCSTSDRPAAPIRSGVIWPTSATPRRRRRPCRTGRGPRGRPPLYRSRPVPLRHGLGPSRRRPRSIRRGHRTGAANTSAFAGPQTPSSAMAGRDQTVALVPLVDEEALLLIGRHREVVGPFVHRVSGVPRTQSNRTLCPPVDAEEALPKIGILLALESLFSPN